MIVVEYSYIFFIRIASVNCVRKYRNMVLRYLKQYAACMSKHHEYECMMNNETGY
jgi:hypothetical protein